MNIKQKYNRNGNLQASNLWAGHSSNMKFPQTSYSQKALLVAQGFVCIHTTQILMPYFVQGEYVLNMWSDEYIAGEKILKK